MAVQTRSVLKTYFETGDKPTAAQFGDLIDSALTAARQFVSSSTINVIPNTVHDVTISSSQLTANCSVFNKSGNFIESAVINTHGSNNELTVTGTGVTAKYCDGWASTTQTSSDTTVSYALMTSFNGVASGTSVIVLVNRAAYTTTKQ